MAKIEGAARKAALSARALADLDRWIDAIGWPGCNQPPDAVHTGTA